MSYCCHWSPGTFRGGGSSDPQASSCYWAALQNVPQERLQSWDDKRKIKRRTQAEKMWPRGCYLLELLSDFHPYEAPEKDDPHCIPFCFLLGPHLFIQVSVHLFNKYLVST